MAFAGRILRLGSFVVSRMVLASVLSSAAEAHVKWFCGPADVTLLPLALPVVLSRVFLFCGVVFFGLSSRPLD